MASIRITVVGAAPSASRPTLVPVQPALSDQLEEAYGSARDHAEEMLGSARDRVVAYAEQGPVRVQMRLSLAERSLAALEAEIGQSSERTHGLSRELGSRMRMVAEFLHARADDPS